MGTEILAYNHVSELAGIISSVTKRFESTNLRFVIPSRKDKFYWPGSPQELWTWQEIYEDICKDSGTRRKRVLSPPDHLLILKSILSDVLASLPDKASSWPGLSRSGFPSVLSADIRDLLNESVSPDKLTNDPDASEPSEFLLPEVYSRYLDYLANNDLIDSAQIATSAYHELLGNQEWGRELVIVFTGFLSFNHSQLELVRGLADRCKSVLVIKPEVRMSRFHDVNYQLGMSAESRPSSGRIIELPCAEPGLEPEVIARTLARWSQGQWGERDFPGFDSVGVMIGSGREDSFAQAFRRYGIPYNFDAGIMINLTLPGLILGSIRNLSTRNFPTYDTAMLLTQPCFAGTGFPVMKAYRFGASGLDGWEEYLAGNEELTSGLLAIQAIRKFCNTLSRKNTPARIMRAFHEFLTTKGLWLDRFTRTGDYPEMDEAIRVTASAIETVGDKALALEELMPDLGRVKDDKMSNDEAYEYLEDWCRNTATRPPLKISNAVRIFTSTPPVLASFDVWVMTGVTQKTWSGNVKSSPLLGNDERRRINENDAYLPLSQDEASQHEALFRRLLQTGEKVTLISRPELDDEGRPVSESPFMRRFKADYPAWNDDASSLAGINILLGSDGFTFRGIDAGDKLKRSAPAIKRKADTVGASDIHELLNCPFLWWQKRQAKLYEQDSDISSPVEWGNMIHRYWESVWIHYREDVNASGHEFVRIAKDEWQVLKDAAKTENAYSEYRHLLSDWRLKRHLEGVEFRVERLAGVQASILDALHDNGYTHEAVMLEENAQLIAHVDGVTFLGQCDRIELLRSPEGEMIAFIADYKEGKSESSEKGMNIEGYSWNDKNREKFIFGLQLSVYSSLFKQCRLGGVYILGLEDGKIAGSFAQDVLAMFTPYGASKPSSKKPGGMEPRVDEGEYAMKCAAKILSAGRFMPEYDNADGCRYCKIKSLCRKGEFRGESLLDSEDNDEE